MCGGFVKKLLIKNGTLITLGLDNRVIDNAYLLISDNIIESFGSGTPDLSDDDSYEVIDAGGKLIMPGFINQHMHFYSTFARGLCPKQPPAENFKEILERLWWPLDNTLNAKDIYYSTMVPVIDGIKSGVTTFFDHHESQGFQLNSLDVIADVLKETNMRGCLSLGISDRYGKGSDGVKENIRFMNSLKSNNAEDDLVAGMFGFHAMFTVNDKTIRHSVEAEKDFNCGFHVHVSEGSLDNDINMSKYGKTAVQRLYEAGCLGNKTTAIHCVCIDDHDMNLIKQSGASVVHVPQSNMNNAVGVAPVLTMLGENILVGLGTDGMSAGVVNDVRTANILHKLNTGDPRVFFSESCKLLLENNSCIASRHFKKKIGVIEENAYADIILVDYNPPTPLDDNTFLGHFLFGICDAEVDTTIVNGKVLMKNRVLQSIDEESVFAESRVQAKDFRERF